MLIGPASTPWITDFGLSTSANATSISQSSAGGRGTLPFKAPELFSYPPQVSQAADVYAFAVLAWCVVSGEQPFANMESAAPSIPTAVDQGERPTLASGGDWRELTTSNIAKLIDTCWAGKIVDRPEFGTAKVGIVAMLEKLETTLTKSADEAAQVRTRWGSYPEDKGRAQARLRTSCVHHGCVCVLCFRTFPSL